MRREQPSSSASSASALPLFFPSLSKGKHKEEEKTRRKAQGEEKQWLLEEKTDALPRSLPTLPSSSAALAHGNDLPKPRAARETVQRGTSGMERVRFVFVCHFFAAPFDEVASSLLSRSRSLPSTPTGSLCSLFQSHVAHRAQALHPMRVQRTK